MAEEFDQRLELIRETLSGWGEYLLIFSLTELINPTVEYCCGVSTSSEPAPLIAEQYEDSLTNCIRERRNSVTDLGQVAKTELKYWDVIIGTGPMRNAGYALVTRHAAASRDDVALLIAKLQHIWNLPDDLIPIHRVFGPKLSSSLIYQIPQNGDTPLLYASSYPVDENSAEVINAWAEAAQYHWIHPKAEIIRYSAANSDKDRYHFCSDVRCRRFPRLRSIY